MQITPRFILLISLLFAFSACERDMTEPAATLVINNSNALAVWAVYVAPTASPTERSMDLLGSVALDAATSRTFSIDTCGLLIDVSVRLSNGYEQNVSSTAAVNCNDTYTCDIDIAGMMLCN